MFFYLVGVVKGLQPFLILGGILLGVCSLPLWIMLVDEYDEDDRKALFKRARQMVTICVVMVTLGLFVPQPTAFYAGAGQYVVETEEVNETLLRLKAAVDKKLDELAASEQE